MADGANSTGGPRLRDARGARDAGPARVDDAVVSDDAVWARLSDVLHSSGPPLHLLQPPLGIVASRTGPTWLPGHRVVAGLTLASLALVVAAAALVGVSATDRSASAALLESARSLSVLTERAAADGTLTQAEVASLQAQAMQLLQQLEGDPARLQTLRADDLAVLTQVLTTAQTQLRLSETGASVSDPVLLPLGTAASLATTALRDSAPMHPVVVARDRTEQPSAALTGVRTIRAGEAGSVDVSVQGGWLRLLETAPVSGWTVEVDHTDDREVDLTFRRMTDGKRIRLSVRLENGIVQTRLDDAALVLSATPTPSPVASGSPAVAGGLPVRPAETTTNYPAADAGTVTLRHDGSDLALVSVTPSAGWSHEVERASGGKVRIIFSGVRNRVQFEADLSGGLVRTRVEVLAGSEGAVTSGGSGGSASSGASSPGRDSSTTSGSGDSGSSGGR